jgi:hypothetical protein
MQLTSLVVGALALVYVISSTSNRGLMRFLAPESIGMIMLFAIFSVRPLFGNRFDEQLFYGFVPSPAGQHTALVVGTVSMAAYALGCFICSVRPTRAAELAQAQKTTDGRSVELSAEKAVVFAIAGAALYVVLLLAVAGSSTVAALSGGRSAEVAIAGVPEFVLIVPMSGSVAVAIFLLYRRGTYLSLREVLLCLFSIAVSLVLLSQLGNRRFLIPAALIPVIAGLLRRRIAVRAYHVLIAAVAFMFVAIVPMVRSAGARMPGENLLSASWRYLGDEGISGVFTPVFASYDTEMLDYIALMSERLPPNTGIGFGLGKGTLVEFLLRPLPSSITGTQYSDALLTSVWGGGCGQPVCPVASVAGVLYFEGGILAVGLGTFLFAVILRWLSNRLAYSATLATMPATAVVVASAFALVATRTNTVHSLWWVIYTLALTYGIYLLSSRRIRLRSSPIKLDPRSPLSLDARRL